MAEGEALQSIRNGSDADLDFTCTPCQEGEISEEAFKYCPECEEYLCRTCTTHHSRQKATRSHKLYSLEDVKKHGTVFATATKCPFHQERCVEMYCSSHDMVYCTLCIATDHRSCSGVKKNEDYVKSLSCEHNDLKLLESEMKIIHKNLVVTKEKKQKNIDSLHHQNEEIKSMIEEVNRRVVDKLETLKGNLNDSLETTYHDSCVALESEITEISKKIVEVEKTTQLIENASNMEEVQRFVQIKIAQKLSTDAKKLQNRNEISIQFSENERMSAFLRESWLFGKVNNSYSTENRIKKAHTKLKSKREVNIKTEADKERLCILDVCQLPDGTIILADCKNYCIKRLDKNNAIKDSCTVDDKPNTVCCIKPNTVAVKMQNNSVQLINVDSSMTKLTQIPTESGKVCGLAYCFDQLWVSASVRVNVYDMYGKLLKYIDKNASGGNLSYVQHIAVQGHTIFVTCNDDGVTSFNMNGTVIKEYRDPRLKYCRGVCVSAEGTVFLSGYNSKNIIMFSGDGICLGELVSADAGLGNIVALCYDNRKDTLIVTSDFSENVYMLELSP